MSHMSPTPSYSEVIAVRVMREQEWVYEQRLAHLSIAAISRLSMHPEGAGGLGYPLSPQAVKGLLNGYLERMRETLEESPAEHIARELADLDLQYRAAMQLASRVDHEATMLKRYAEGDPEWPEVYRDEKVVLAALQTMRQIGESRRKLLGTDAAVVQKVDVTVTDAVDAEVARLAAELEGGMMPATPPKE